jgi:hypothetical protein
MAFWQAIFQTQSVKNGVTLTQIKKPVQIQNPLTFLGQSSV